MEKRTSPSTERTPNPFIAHHSADLLGVIHGLDRVRLQGTLRCLYQPAIFQESLSQAKVLLKDFKGFVMRTTAAVRQQAETLAQSCVRPFEYLRSVNVNKEERARQLAQANGVREGLIGVFNCVEGCRTYRVYGNRESRKLELRLEWGKCSHLYFYVQHPRWGFLHLRLQTWEVMQNNLNSFAVGVELGHGNCPGSNAR